MKRLLYLLLVLILIASCKSHQAVVLKSNSTTVKYPQLIYAEKSKANFANNPKYNAHLSEKIVRKAQSKLDKPYKSGGTTDSGYDCSGFVFSIFSAFDIVVPRSSIEMAKFGTRLKVKDAKKGDLVLFKNNSKQINHVGIIVDVSDDEIKFIHAASRGGVIISTTSESYYNQNIVQINRVIN